MYSLRLFVGKAVLLFCLAAQGVSATLQRHDASFSPDHVLYATVGNVTIDCESRYSVLLNGSTPGPAIYLEEGKTSWIRVFNKIPDDNLTVVCIAQHSTIGKATNFLALAWSHSEGRTLF